MAFFNKGGGMIGEFEVFMESGKAMMRGSSSICTQRRSCLNADSDGVIEAFRDKLHDDFSCVHDMQTLFPLRKTILSPMQGVL